MLVYIMASMQPTPLIEMCTPSMLVVRLEIMKSYRRLINKRTDLEKEAVGILTLAPVKKRSLLIRGLHDASNFARGCEARQPHVKIWLESSAPEAENAKP